MLESIVELLAGLFLIALTLLMGSCIVGSIVAALRAVSNGSSYDEHQEVKQVFSFVAELSVSDDRMVETGAMATTIADIDY